MKRQRALRRFQPASEPERTVRVLSKHVATATRTRNEDQPARNFFTSDGDVPRNGDQPACNFFNFSNQ